MSVRSFKRARKTGLMGGIPQKTHKTALVIIPPKEIYPPIQRIRKRYDRQFHRWMPHVNLLYPFLPKSEFSKALDLLWLVCEKTEPFETDLDGVRFFTHGKGLHTLWLTLQPVASIRDFQKRLLRVFPECDDLNRYSSGFTPHLSIGQIKGADRVKAIQSELEHHWKPLSFQVNQVHLIWRKAPPNDRFQIGETVRFGGTST